MKIALILSGHMRGYSYTYDSFRSMILDKYETDVFISTWNNLGWWTADNNNLISQTKDPIDWDKVSKLYNPKILDIENYYEDKYDIRFQEESIKFIKFLKDNRIRVVNPISMYYKFQKSIQIFNNYRNENNHHYDVVIKTRPDCYLSKNINIIKSNILYSDYGRGICGGGTGDVFIMSDQENMLKFSDIYNSLYEISESIDFFCPHRIIEKFIKQKNIIHNEISGFTLHNSKNGQWRE